MQTLVLAHAAFGCTTTSSRTITSSSNGPTCDGILDYLAFAKNFIAACEDKYGAAEVERVLDAAHALQNQGVHRYPGKRQMDLRSEETGTRAPRAPGRRLFNDLWRTVPEQLKVKRRSERDRRRALLGLPREYPLFP